MSARKGSLIRRNTAWVFVVLWTLSLCPQEFWHHCFEAHAELAAVADEGIATLSDACAVCDTPAPLAEKGEHADHGVFLPFIGKGLLCSVDGPEQIRKWRPEGRGPPQPLS
ncbi:MAG: hypothetical protein KDC00_00645 [Flavobacteriales bacterium]|nr:hypothetical protein [Flavobacteriales bacterium]